MPLMIMANSPTSSSGVRILPTMSTTADSLMHRAMITAKNTTENTTGDTPERLGEIAISKVVAEVRGIATMGPMHRMMTHISTSAGTVPPAAAPPHCCLPAAERTAPAWQARCPR